MPPKKRTPIKSFQDTISLQDSINCGGKRMTVQTASRTDVQYVLDRARKWSNEVGFIPAQGIETLIEEGRCLVARMNGERCGYLLTSGGFLRPLVVRHNTIEEDLWSQGLGTSLMASVLSWARWTKRGHVLVRTRRDIEHQVKINRHLAGGIVDTDVHVGERGQPVDLWTIPRTPVLFDLAGLETSSVGGLPGPKK